MASSIDKDNIDKVWKEWAKTDWLEFLQYLTRTYGAAAVNDAQDEFAKQMGISGHALDILTNIAVGKVGGIISAPASMTMDVLDLFTKVAGLIFYNGAQSLVPATRANPHNLWTSSWSGGDWYYEKGDMPLYVQYIIYCYPKNRKLGYRGFRYGAEQPKRQGQMPPPPSPLPTK